MAGDLSQSQAAGQPESRPPRERPWLLPYVRSAPIWTVMVANGLARIAS